MPELPEVETVVRGLREVLVGRTILKVKHFAPQSSIVVSESFGGRLFQSLLRGRQVTKIKRTGKNIFIELDNETTLWVHLKMTGRFRTEENEKSIQKHDLVVLHLSPNGNESSGSILMFNDYRRFGRLRLYRNDELWQQNGLRQLGPEPFDITTEEFIARCRRTNRMIKPALLDQTFLAGIGNIYADESLYAARIHPRRLTRTVSTKKLSQLHEHINRILRLAIENMGSSVDTYSGVDGKPGSFQNYLKAYGRESEKCERCNRRIVREKIGSRSAFYCPNCQRI